MIGFDVELKGFKELESQLVNLERGVAREIVKTSLKRSIVPLINAMRRNAKYLIKGEMGALIAHSVMAAGMKIQKRFSYGIRAMLDPSEKRFIHITKKGVRHYIPSAIEYGHALPYQSGDKGKAVRNEKGQIVRRVKSVAAIPALRRAADDSENEVMEVFRQELNQAIDNALRESYAGMAAR